MVPPWAPSFTRPFGPLHVGSRRAEPGSAQKHGLIANGQELTPFAGMTRIRFYGFDLSRS
jgi:hypothetical protein